MTGWPDRRLWGQRIGLWFMVSVCLLVCGCKQTLYTQLAEQEANEMLAALALADIAVAKVAGEKYWGIEVDASDIPRAMHVLARDGLPRSRYSSMADLFKREALVSTPTEERVRFIHGLSQELSKTLSMIDGVIAARVHIVLPHNDPLADRTKPSSASVFIRHRAEADLQRELTAIKSLVVRSVEGVTYDTVHVSLFAAERLPLVRAEGKPADSGTSDAAARWSALTVFRGPSEPWQVAVLGLAIGILISLGCYWVWRRFVAPPCESAAP